VRGTSREEGSILLERKESLHFGKEKCGKGHRIPFLEKEKEASGISYFQRKGRGDG